jgi:hypothetical protein
MNVKTNFATKAIEVRCAVCGGNSIPLACKKVSDGKLPTYTCKDCAQKRDKLGRSRKARDRKSLDLDHHTLRIDGERRGHERPAGMKNGSMVGDLLEWGVVRKATAPDGQLSEDRYELLPLLPGDSRVEEARHRVELRRWAELHVFDCPEFLDLRPQDRAILKLFSADETVRSIGERLGISKSKAANAVHDAIENMQKRIEAARGHDLHSSPASWPLSWATGSTTTMSQKRKGLRMWRNLTLPGASRLWGALMKRNHIKKENKMTGTPRTMPTTCWTRGQVE